MNAKDVIDQARSALQEARSHGRGRRFLKQFVRPTPDWSASNNADRYFDAQERLLQEGDVRMAVLVSAKPHMFEAGRVNDDCLLAVAEGDDFELEWLEAARSRLENLGEHAVEDDFKRTMGKALRLTGGWIYGLDVPESLGIKVHCRLSHSMAMRLCFPKRFVSGRLLPVVVHGDAPGAAMILPSEYWPEELLASWGCEREKPTLGVGGFTAVMILAAAYLGAGMFAGNCVRWLVGGELGENWSEQGGAAWFMAGLNLVGGACLILLARKVPSEPEYSASDFARRPWYDKVSRLPLTERIAFQVWAAVYLIGLILGLVFQ